MKVWINWSFLDVSLSNTSSRKGVGWSSPIIFHKKNKQTWGYSHPPMCSNFFPAKYKRKSHFFHKHARNAVAAASRYTPKNEANFHVYYVWYVCTHICSICMNWNDFRVILWTKNLDSFQNKFPFLEHKGSSLIFSNFKSREELGKNKGS